MKGFNVEAMQAVVIQKIEAIPGLSMHGFGVFGENQLPPEIAAQKLQQERRVLVRSDSLRAVFLLMEWSKERLQAVNEINYRLSSYALKHLAEKEVGYVSNGQMILALILLGYDWAGQGADAFFNVVISAETI